MNDTQKTLLRYLLLTPRSTPIPALSWDFGIFPMKYRIIVRKLCLVKHILSLDESALAKQIFIEQEKLNFPGLVREIKELIMVLNLPDITDKKVNAKISKMSWKKLVKSVVSKMCESELRNEIDTLDKLTKSEMSKENFETKNYTKELKIDSARIKFKIRTEMIDAKFNYKNDYQNRACLWKCDSCQSSIDTQDHILWCPAYHELRKGKNIKNDSDLIDYFKKVMKIREKLRLTK